MKVKRKTVSSLKKIADAIFSEYIRKKYADFAGYVRCFTCGKLLHWKQMQNGHFIERSNLKLRYDERNCRPQCIGCNIFKKGNMVEYAVRLEKQLGKASYQQLYQDKLVGQKGYPLTIPMLEGIIEKYKRTEG